MGSPMPKVLKDPHEVASFDHGRLSRFSSEDFLIGLVGSFAMAALIGFGFLAVHFLAR